MAVIEQAIDHVGHIVTTLENIEGRIIDLIGVEEEDETPDPDPEPEPNPDQTPIPDPDPSPDPTPNPDDQNGVDEDQDPINDGKTDDDTNEDGTRTDDDQGRQSGVGGTLPNTATNSYTILLVGGVLLQDYVIIDKYACSK